MLLNVFKNKKIHFSSWTPLTEHYKKHNPNPITSEIIQPMTEENGDDAQPITNQENRLQSMNFEEIDCNLTTNQSTTGRESYLPVRGRRKHYRSRVIQPIKRKDISDVIRSEQIINEVACNIPAFPPIRVEHESDWVQPIIKGESNDVTAPHPITKEEVQEEQEEVIISEGDFFVRD